MAQTPNFDITEVAANQNQKEVTINTGFVELEAALSNFLAVAMPDADYTLSTGEGGQALGNVAFQFTGTITSDRNIIVPINKKLYLVMNNTSTSLGFNLVVKTPSGTGVSIPPNNTRYTWVYCDGTNVLAAGPTPGAGAGTVTNNEGALTAHEVVLGNGGDDAQALGSVGTAGQVLTSNGPGNDPSWQAGGGGGGGGTWSAITAKRQVVVDMAQTAAGTAPANATCGLGIDITVMGTTVGWQQPSVSLGVVQQPGSYQFNNGSADTIGGIRPFTNNYTPFCMGLNLQFFSTASLTRTTDERFWLGITGTLSGSTSTDFGGFDLPGAGFSGTYIGFRYSTVAGDMNYQCICSDGSNDTVVDSGVPADIIAHRFAIVVDDTGHTSKFYIDGNLVATISTHQPAAGVVLGYVAGVAWHSGSGAALNLGCIVMQGDF